MTRKTNKSRTQLHRIVGKRSLAFRVGHILLGIVLLIWPYIFAAEVWKHHRQGGLQASDTLARLVQTQPHNVDFLFTTIAVVISAIMTYQFTTAFMCLYWDKIRNDNTFFLLFYRSIKHDPEKWPVLKLFYIIVDGHLTGFGVVLLMLFYSMIFTLVSPGLNALLIPHSFHRIAPLQGYELNFSSTDAICTEWIANNPIPSECNWRVSVTHIPLNMY